MKNQSLLHSETDRHFEVLISECAKNNTCKMAPVISGKSRLILNVCGLMILCVDLILFIAALVLAYYGKY